MCIGTHNLVIKNSRLAIGGNRKADARGGKCPTPAAIAAAAAAAAAGRTSPATVVRSGPIRQRRRRRRQ